MDNKGYEWYNNILEKKTARVQVIYEVDGEGDTLIEIRDENQCLHTILHKNQLLQIADYIRKFT